jgi:hypothetical protein
MLNYPSGIIHPAIVNISLLSGDQHVDSLSLSREMQKML